MMLLKPLSFLLCLMLLASQVSANESMEDLLMQARQALIATQPHEALSVLLKYEEDYAGVLEFDYWLGVAATRSREPGLALLALSRVLIQQPLHAGARLERIGAYLQLDRNQEAASELDRLESLNPPPQAQMAIDQYRRLLAERERRQVAPSHFIMLTSELGYDTNVGRTPDGYQLCLGELFCTDPFSEEASSYASFRGVYRYRHPWDANNRLDTTFIGQYRGYEKDHLEGYNLAALQGRVAWRHALSLEEFVSLEANSSRIWLDKPLEAYSWQTGFLASWERPVLAASTHRLAGHWRLNRHDEMKRNNFQAFGLDNQLSYPVSERLEVRPSLLLELEKAGRDGPATSPQRPGGDLHRLRLGLGAGYQLSPRHSLSSHLSYSRLLYQDPDFALYNQGQAIRRQESRWEASLDYNWILDRHWMLNLQAQHRRQDANIDFYANTQSLVQAGITYIWQGTGQR